MDKKYKTWSEDEKRRAIKMRRACVRPEVIAETLGRSLGVTRNILTRSGVKFPRLRYKNLKYNLAAVQRWRDLERAGYTRAQIRDKEGVHPVIISRKYAQEIYGELMY